MVRWACSGVSARVRTQPARPDGSADALEAFAFGVLLDGLGDVRGPGGDGGDAGRPKRTAITITSGGGTSTSTGYRMTISIGTPQPMGAASSAGYRAGVGPGAVQNQ